MQVKSTETEIQEQCAGAKIYEKLQMYMETLAFFDDNIDDYIYMYDLKSERVYVTDKIREKFPLPPAGDNGNAFSDWSDMVYSKDRDLLDHYRQLLADGLITSFNISYRLLDRKGNKVWVNVRGSVREDESEQTLLVVGRISEIALGSVVDSLTGLWNADQFMEDMKRCLEDREGFLMVLGVDNFKNINITQGRSFGDQILKMVTGILEDQLEYPMSLYRLNGDCFAVNFPEKRQADVIDYYNAVRKAMKKYCTVSAGVVYYKHGDPVDSGAIYQYAETALDQAKKERKARLIFFSSDDYRKNLEQVELLNELKACVQDECKGFYLHYQPQISSQNFEIHGAEALLRYDSPSRGRIDPVEFIPLLEESGLICPVGEWVLRTAIRQCKEWRTRIPNLHISVNISYVQLRQDGITDIVLDLLEEEGLPGDALTLEVTESMQLQDYTYYNKIFYAWKQYGIKVAIDDFGTGYSSLSYLKSIEIDEIKIHRCFVDHIQHNAYNFRLLSNMIELAHSAQIQVCCEGVETVEELMALQELHTDLQQGFLFAKPYAKEEFEQSYLCAESPAYQERKAKEDHFRQIDTSETEELLEGLRKEEIGNIIEGMEEVVYVSDVDTYEMYYLNAEGRRVTGVYDYKGCKCYKVLQGRDSPCEFCTNQRLNKDHFYVWEIENNFYNRYYLIKDKLIPWLGKMVRLEIAIDITEKEVVSQSIQKKLDFEQAIVDSCKMLASEADPKQSGQNVLRVIGEFYRADRVYLLRPTQKEELWDICLEWTAEAVPSIGSYFPMELDRIRQQDVSRPGITAPIMRNHRMMGLLCVDNPQIQEAEYDLAKTMAYFLGYGMVGEESQNSAT